MRRRPTGPTTRQQRKRTEARQGLAYLVAGVALLSSLGFFYWWAKGKHPPLDGTTNCPLSGPTAIHAILVDKSDAISPLQAQQVSQYLQKVIGSSTAGERFDLYVATANESATAIPIVSLCSPGSPELANSLYENPKRVAQLFERDFKAPLDRSLNQLMEPSTRSTSPILESIRGVAVNSFGSTDRSAVPLTLSIVSDMIQNTPAYSQLRGDISFQALERQPQWRLLQPNLSGVKVDILYLLRPGKNAKGDPIQTRAHQAFWEHAIAASGGSLHNLESY